jgi:hypothetical protein
VQKIVHFAISYAKRQKCFIAKKKLFSSTAAHDSVNHFTFNGEVSSFIEGLFVSYSFDIGPSIVKSRVTCGTLYVPFAQLSPISPFS